MPIAESNETNNNHDVTQITVTASATSPAAALSNATSTSGDGMLIGDARNDTFVFAAVSRDVIAGNPPGLDHIQFDRTVVTTAPDSGLGNAAPMALTLHDATVDMLPHHLNDFFIV